VAIPVSAWKASLIDYGRETGHMRVFITTLTGANLTTVSGKITTLQSALANMVKGNFNRTATQASRVLGSGDAPTDPVAQREVKWLVRYHDAAGRKFNVEIPTADLSLLDTGDEFLDLATTYPAAFVAAFEDVVVSPADDGSAVTVDSIQFVGRRS